PLPWETIVEPLFHVLLIVSQGSGGQFFNYVSKDELARFALAFPAGKIKPSELAQQLKAALAGMQGIHINEICFLATHARLKQSTCAAKRATASLEKDKEQEKEWLNDRKKMLELIAAAKGSKGAGTIGAGPAPADAADASQPGAGMATTGCGVGGDADGVFLG